LSEYKKTIWKIKKVSVEVKLIKCLFGVKSRKLPGFVVSSQDIEVDLGKVKAIQTMPAPRTKKKSKRVLGLFKLHCSVYISNDSNFWANLLTHSKEKSWGMERQMPRNFQ
jgi:hypothetical protein